MVPPHDDFILTRKPSCANCFSSPVVLTGRGHPGRRLPEKLFRPETGASYRKTQCMRKSSHTLPRPRNEDGERPRPKPTSLQQEGSCANIKGMEEHMRHRGFAVWVFVLGVVGLSLAAAVPGRQARAGIPGRKMGFRQSRSGRTPDTRIRLPERGGRASRHRKDHDDLRLHGRALIR